MTWKEHLLLTANYFLGLHRSRLYLLSSGTTEIVFIFGYCCPHSRISPSYGFVKSIDKFSTREVRSKVE